MTLILILICSACGTSGPTTVPQNTPAPTAASKEAYIETMRQLNVGQYLAAVQTTRTTRHGDWQTYSFGLTEGAVCRDGSDFITSVYKSTPPSNKVALYLQGGGGCWSAASCNGIPFATKNATIPDGRDQGIFDHDNPQNPIFGWNIVYATYCDGSVFSGDNTVYYAPQKPTYHWGLRNLSAAINVMKKEFPAPDQILVTGSSAGGFGTLMGMGVARLAYPEHPLYIFNDAGPGIENNSGEPEMNALVRENWQFTQFIPPECEACNEQLVRLIDYAMAHDPDLYAALYLNRHDYVIGSLFLRMYEEYPINIRTITDEIHSLFPDRYKRYIAEGMEHTIIGSSALYGRKFRGNLTVGEWMKAFLAQSDAWQDYR